MPTPRRTLLVADDSPTVRKVVGLTFEDEGFRVVAVESGAAALAEIEREVPDVLLADVHMPAPGGYELCARVRADERTRRVPVMLLVGAFEPFDEAEARSCGADEVLTKPFQSIRDLVNKVGGLLGAQHDAPPPSGRTDAARTNDATAGDARRDEARAAGPTPGAQAATASHEEAHAASPEEARDASSPEEGARAAAHPFADFGADDADIETVPAAEFDARRPASAESFAEDTSFSEDAASFHAAAVSSTDAAEESAANAQAVSSQRAGSESFASPESSEASQPSESSESFDRSESFENVGEFNVQGFNVQGFNEPASDTQGSHAQGFEARAAAAEAADDTLLELGDIDTQPARASATGDDFVLDFDGDTIFPPPSAYAYDEPARNASPRDASSEFASSEFASSPSWHDTSSSPEPSYGEPAYGDAGYGAESFSEDAPTAVEMQSAGSVSMAEPSGIWDAAQEFTVAPDAVTEPVSAPAWEEPEVRPLSAEDAAALVGRDAAQLHVAGADDAASHATTTAADAHATDADATDSQAAQGVGAQLSPESIDAIARRVVELLSDRVVREIAWEVVPDLAERLIKQKLEEERARQ